LLVVAECAECGEEFAMQPQDASRADVHNHPKVCRMCVNSYRRRQRSERNVSGTSR
jgi:formylmethanofuran dehydrogenase subunit E